MEKKGAEGTLCFYFAVFVPRETPRLHSPPHDRYRSPANLTSHVRFQGFETGEPGEGPGDAQTPGLRVLRLGRAFPGHRTGGPSRSSAAAASVHVSEAALRREAVLVLWYVCVRSAPLPPPLLSISSPRHFYVNYLASARELPPLVVALRDSLATGSKPS